jgi:hypothetical protein
MQLVLNLMQKTVLKRQGLQKNVLKRQGRLVRFDCALLVITNKCNHVAWISDI